MGMADGTRGFDHAMPSGMAGWSDFYVVNELKCGDDCRFSSISLHYNPQLLSWTCTFFATEA